MSTVEWLRVLAAAAGIALVALGIGVSATIGEAPVALVITLAGLVLILYAFIWDRLESFGPRGVTLFERQREDIAKRVEGSLSVTGTGSIRLEGDKVQAAHSNAAAKIRAARNPDELADVLVALIDAPENRSDQAKRVLADDGLRANQERGGARTGSRDRGGV